MEKQQHKQVRVTIDNPKTIWNTVVGFVGLCMTFLAADFTESAIAKKFKEIPSAWAVSDAKGFMGGLYEGVAKLFDLKQWKSSAAFLGIAAVGVLLTKAIVGKVYAKHEVVRVVGTVDEMPVDSPVSGSTKNWAQAETHRETADAAISR